MSASGTSVPWTLASASATSTAAQTRAQAKAQSQIPAAPLPGPPDLAKQFDQLAMKSAEFLAQTGATSRVVPVTSVPSLTGVGVGLKGIGTAANLRRGSSLGRLPTKQAIPPVPVPGALRVQPPVPQVGMKDTTSNIHLTALQNRTQQQAPVRNESITDNATRHHAQSDESSDAGASPPRTTRVSRTSKEETPDTRSQAIASSEPRGNDVPSLLENVPGADTLTTPAMLKKVVPRRFDALMDTPVTGTEPASDTKDEALSARRLRSSARIAAAVSAAVSAASMAVEKVRSVSMAETPVAAPSTTVSRRGSGKREVGDQVERDEESKGTAASSSQSAAAPKTALIGRTRQKKQEPEPVQEVSSPDVATNKRQSGPRSHMRDTPASKAQTITTPIANQRSNKNMESDAVGVDKSDTPVSTIERLSRRVSAAAASLLVPETPSPAHTSTPGRDIAASSMSNFITDAASEDDVHDLDRQEHQPASGGGTTPPVPADSTEGAQPNVGATTSGASDVPVKRGRGRPKGSTKAAKALREAGLSQTQPSTSQSAPSLQLRKTVSAATASSSSTTAPPTGENGGQPVKRGRGRPRKHPVPDQAPPLSSGVIVPPIASVSTSSAAAAAAAAAVAAAVTAQQSLRDAALFSATSTTPASSDSSSSSSSSTTSNGDSDEPLVTPLKRGRGRPRKVPLSAIREGDEENEDDDGPMVSSDSSSRSAAVRTENSSSSSVGGATTPSTARGSNLPASTPQSPEDAFFALGKRTNPVATPISDEEIRPEKRKRGRPPKVHNESPSTSRVAALAGVENPLAPIAKSPIRPYQSTVAMPSGTVWTHAQLDLLSQAHAMTDATDLRFWRTVAVTLYQLSLGLVRFTPIQCAEAWQYLNFSSPSADRKPQRSKHVSTTAAGGAAVGAAVTQASVASVHPQQAAGSSNDKADDEATDEEKEDGKELNDDEEKELAAAAAIAAGLANAPTIIGKRRGRPPKVVATPVAASTGDGSKVHGESGDSAAEDSQNQPKGRVTKRVRMLQTLNAALRHSNNEEADDVFQHVTQTILPKGKTAPATPERKASSLPVTSTSSQESTERTTLSPQHRSISNSPKTIGSPNRKREAPQAGQSPRQISALGFNPRALSNIDFGDLDAITASVPDVVPSAAGANAVGARLVTPASLLGSTESFVRKTLNTSTATKSASTGLGDITVAASDPHQHVVSDKFVSIDQAKSGAYIKELRKASAQGREMKVSAALGKPIDVVNKSPRVQMKPKRAGTLAHEQMQSIYAQYSTTMSSPNERTTSRQTSGVLPVTSAALGTVSVKLRKGAASAAAEYVDRSDVAALIERTSRLHARAAEQQEIEGREEDDRPEYYGMEEEELEEELLEAEAIASKDRLLTSTSTSRPAFTETDDYDDDIIGHLK